MDFYSRLFRLTGEIKGVIATKVIIGLSITAAYVIQAFAMARGISIVLDGGYMGDFIKMILISFLCIIARCLLMYANEKYSKKAACDIKKVIRGKVLEKLLFLGPGYQTKKRSGNLQSLITDGVETLEAFLTNYIPQLFIVLFSAIGIGTYVWQLNTSVAFVMIIAIVLAVFGPQASMPLVKKFIQGYWQAYAVLNSQFIDAMQGMNTLKVLNGSKRKGKELALDAENFYRKAVRETTLSLLNSSVIILCMAAGYAFSVGVSVIQVSRGQLALSSLFVILFLAYECFRPIHDLNAYWHSSFLGFSAAREVFSIIDTPAEVEESDSPVNHGSDIKLPQISFQNVSFSYDERETKAIKDLNLCIDPGKTAAIVGKSGAGKSTIVSLLLRFFDPQEGQILFNGENAKNYSLDYLRSQIAVVFQDTYLFYGTILDNIRLAKPNASIDEIIEAAQLANAHKFISEFPRGYDTLVGERGISLSGGERQRISIARAILKDAPFLILDEATSSVDAESEGAIQAALEKLVKNRTTLIIAHRLSTVQKADQIFVLEDGVLAEQGKHEDLISEEGIYSRLIMAQYRVKEVQNG
ncbi:ATP-binding cassette domain-containing protein [Alkalibaculum sp. M08DMB]|uniref:ATP-binding cassette domain-containing protein n=1 Tax=Alkalibaculum sporogenes TaxID=2655001 RepID=A0A6A7K8B7_9FIRM|nr:ABC transporter ATP-binding protein [Alkalibaculum sporogenes]MPW25561.1 ATP-binding cassette domain-containing protein [Alkalibaculum sporogenes]